MARDPVCPKCGSNKTTPQHECGEYSGDGDGNGSWACVNYRACHYCGNEFDHDPPKSQTTPRVIDPIKRDWESLVRKYKKGGTP